MSRLVLSLLDPFQAVLDGTLVATFESDKVRALLAYLAVESDRPQRRETLAGLLWPDMPERDARTNLRHVLANLRKAIGDRDAVQPFLLTSRQTLQFNAESDYHLDVKTFTDAIAATIAHPHVKLGDCETCIARLCEAAGLYNGEFLAGFSLDSDLFEAWITTQREKLHIQALDVLDHLVSYHEQRGDYAEVIRYAQRQVDLEPWRESAHRQWMRALACSGQRGMALAQYEACRRVLKAELGIEPEAATTALYENIRCGNLQPPVKPSPDTHPTPTPPVSLTLPLPPASEPELPVSHTSTPALEGERRVVTLLLADVRAATTLLQHADTEAWAELITPALHLLGSEVTRLGGNVEQYRRAGLAACFGGHVAQEDDPERAVLAVLAMREALAAYFAERDAADLSLTVSVHTGEVICTPIGDTTSIMGAVVDSAEAIQASLALGVIWVSEATHHLVASLFTWAPLGENGYEPMVHRPQVDKGRGIAGLSSPLVGRDAELRTLQEATERLRAGIGGIVTVVGEAGIGKSRLVAELHKSTNLQSPNLQWIEGRCLSYATGSAYQVWRDMLHAWLDAPADAAPEAVVTTLRERVRAVCPDAFNDVYPFLAWLLSLPLDTIAATRLRGIDAEGLQFLTFRAVETLLDCAARRIPLALVCEDLHWADAASLALLEHLLALTDRVPLLFVSIFRPEREHGCWHIREVAARTYEHHHTDIRLKALSAAESTQLVGNLLALDVLPQELRAHILERAEGNPFYVEEIVRSLIDDTIIAYDEATGRWYAIREMDERALPDTLYGVLMARIDRLPVGAKRVLQLASVIGRIVSYPLLATIAERSTLDAHLVTLQHARMMREQTRVPQREFIFHHQFTLEAAYEGLLRRARCVLHRRVAEALETLYSDRVEENLGLLAHHWEQAGDTDRAIAYLRRAGEQAAAHYANAEAVAYFSRALDLLPAERLEERLALLLAREDIHNMQGTRDAQQQDLQALQEVVAGLDDQSAQVTVALRRARYADRTGAFSLHDSLLQETLPLIAALPDVRNRAQSYLEWGSHTRDHRTAARAQLEKAVQLAHAAGLKAIEAESLRELGITFRSQGDLEQAISYLERSLSISREIENRKLEGMICNALSLVLAKAGNETEAQRYAELGIRLCREVGNRYDEGWGVWALGLLYQIQGECAAALHYFQQAVASACEIQDVGLELFTFLGVNWVLGDLGRYTEAIAYYEGVLHDVREAGNPMMASMVLSFLGVYVHYVGDDTRAQAIGQEILRVGQTQDEWDVQNWAWIVLGHALTGLGQLDEAGAAYRRALEVALAWGWEWRTWIRTGLIRVALLKGEKEALREALPHVEEILRYWETDPTLHDVPFERFKTCWTCYRLLQALQDPRAPVVLERAYALVQARAAKLKDPAHRRAFLENVVVHRDIIAEWERLHTDASCGQL